MHRLREAIRRRHPDFCENSSWLLHHGNVLVDTLSLLRNFFLKTVTHYLVTVFALSSKLKRIAKGRWFATTMEIKPSSLETQEQSKGRISEVVGVLEKSLAQVYFFWGNYIDGDKIYVVNIFFEKSIKCHIFLTHYVFKPYFKFSLLHLNIFLEEQTVELY